MCEQLHGVKDISLSANKSIRKAYGGTPTAVMALTAELAKTALNMGCIRVGRTNCRIRGKVKLPRCYRCWAIGRIANKSDGPDSPTIIYNCIRCGGGGT